MNGTSDSSAGGPSEGERSGEGAATPSTFGRVRLVLAELERGRGSRALVRVVLERNERRFEATLEGVGEETMLARLGAEATLAALDRAVGGERRFELVGIRDLHAFDTRVVLVCVRPTDEPEQRLVGCVPTPDEVVRGAATAVLHATNRLIEILPPPEGEASEGEASAG